MRLLLDTHVALWAIVADVRLPRSAQDLITDPANIVAVSAASVWEISIKWSLARGRPTDMPISGPVALGYFRSAGYALVSITPEHASAVQGLPPHHRDPFDRMLVAQAIVEPFRLVTHDPQLSAYSDSVILI